MTEDPNLGYLCFKKSVSPKESADHVPVCLIMYDLCVQNLQAAWAVRFDHFVQQTVVHDTAVFGTKELSQVCVCAACNSAEICTHNQ